ncbi:hypothetical protein FCL40_15580 [Ferrimonas sediminicola]|uniref:Uncharacterized protein n=1 Tax=Ferrimonas sediminicola TaxID=2569538 RepID=A0A4U1BBT3_9GAMM|nr:hypothetical protein [Ferrimonas sediminicola]TKB47630.1 hypothetical protein FCL40_15580 [Ferrimonas sediminicola]
MFLVSNYPQVPIVTTNPATDDVRQQALARAPVVPPREAERSASERALDPEHDPVQIPSGGRLKRRQAEGEEPREESSQPEHQAKGGVFELWRPPTFDRPGVRRQESGLAPRTGAHPSVELSDNEYQRFTRILHRRYSQVARPAEPPAFQVSA